MKGMKRKLEPDTSVNLGKRGKQTGASVLGAEEEKIEASTFKAEEKTVVSTSGPEGNTEVNFFSEDSKLKYLRDRSGSGPIDYRFFDQNYHSGDINDIVTDILNKEVNSMPPVSSKRFVFLEDELHWALSVTLMSHGDDVFTGEICELIPGTFEHDQCRTLYDPVVTKEDETCFGVRVHFHNIPWSIRVNPPLKVKLDIIAQGLMNYDV